MRSLDQYTGVNLMNPYSKELMKSANSEVAGQQLSKYAKSYLKAVC